MGSMLPTHPPTYVTLGPTEGFFMLHGSHSLLNKFWKNFFTISKEGVVQFYQGVFEKNSGKKKLFFSTSSKVDFNLLEILFFYFNPIGYKSSFECHFFIEVEFFSCECSYVVLCI